MSGPAATPAPEPIPSSHVAEPRQRWRLVVGRAASAPAQAHRDVTAAWTDALASTDLPLARASGTGSRPRISFGAPLPAGMAADGDLIDVVLVERWPVWRVRDAIDGHTPAGWRLIDLFDVWLNGPPLAGRVAAADYRIELGGTVDVPRVTRAAAGLLAATRLPRERAKGGGTVVYDLRPLLLDIAIAAGRLPVARVRTRFHPELGTGRPDEVLAALGEAVGTPLQAGRIVRERLLLVEDLVED